MFNCIACLVHLLKLMCLLAKFCYSVVVRSIGFKCVLGTNCNQNNEWNPNVSESNNNKQTFFARWDAYEKSQNYVVHWLGHS